VRRSASKWSWSPASRWSASSGRALMRYNRRSRRSRRLGRARHGPARARWRLRGARRGARRS
jgi:hypothetical protein